KIFKGKKLTKISPNKTISGVFGAFIFSIILLILFNLIEDINLIRYIILTLAVSSTSQLGDIFISYIKRKAKVKNTSNILPGHGGLLDRLDGIIFGIPLGLNLALII
ncbi:phosphatidate cytidylyltransferase, partial [Candidatus Pelagibacter sp.]|nr:phosphatidate cytidylyltransferase [Candidatus Pelagibacter sp.]